jgi:hypothetical protein
VESKKGSGSTFYFYIDAVKIENVEKCWKVLGKNFLNYNLKRKIFA